MKILFITPYFAPAWGYGGPPLINYKLAKQLTHDGHDVDVLTTDCLDENRHKKKFELYEGIKVYRFRNLSNWLAWNFKLFFPVGFASHLKKNIKSYDFVFISDLRDYQNIFAYKECIKNKIPYAIAAYGEIQISPGFKAPIKRLYDRVWGLKMINNARYLLGQTDHENSDYKLIGGRKSQIRLLPLAINYEEFKGVKPSPSDNFRSKNGIKRSDKVILFVGRINYLKGIDLIVKSMPKIIKAIPDSKFVIVGRDDGYYLRTLRSMVQEMNLSKNVIFHGPLYGKENLPAYLAADVFAFTPRHSEETSLACLQALALGVPTITTKEAPIPFLEEYKAGYEIKFSEEVLIERLTAILKNTNLRDKMGQNARRLTQEVFDLPNVCHQLEKMIKRAINE